MFFQIYSLPFYSLCRALDSWLLCAVLLGPLPESVGKFGLIGTVEEDPRMDYLPTLVRYGSAVFLPKTVLPERLPSIVMAFTASVNCYLPCSLRLSSSYGFQPQLMPDVSLLLLVFLFLFVGWFVWAYPHFANYPFIVFFSNSPFNVYTYSFLWILTMGFFLEPEYITSIVVSQLFNYVALKVYVSELLSPWISLYLSLFVFLVSFIITYTDISKSGTG